MGSTTPYKLPGIPEITADQMTPVVVMLLELCHKQQEQIQALRDELARLKGQGKGDREKGRQEKGTLPFLQKIKIIN